MKKKILNRIIALCFVFLFSFMMAASTAYAADESQNENQYYTYRYGDEEIRYLLDENQQPYYESNGERICLALPLEQLKVTDEELLAELNAGLSNASARSTFTYTPTSYHNLADGPYEKTLSLSKSYTYTDTMKMDPTKEIIRIRTSEEVKNSIFAGKKISYVAYYYSVLEDAWYQYTVNDVNCSNDVGAALNLSSGQLYPYVYYGVKKSSDLSSVKVTCWCTDV